MTTLLYGRDDLRGCCRLDIDDLRLLWLLCRGGGDELVSAISEASAPTAVAGRDDDQCHTDNSADDGTCDCTGVGFTTVSTAAYFFTSHCM